MLASCKALAPIFAALFIFLTSFSAIAQGPNEKPASVPYNMNEIQTFWDTNLRPLILGQLVAKKYHLSEIQRDFSEMETHVFKIYGKPIAIRPSSAYCKYSRAITNGVDIIDGNPSMVIFIPAIMDVYPQYATAPERKKTLEAMNVARFMHEMEHLMTKAPPIPLQTKEWFVSDETNTWAKTCEQVIAVFVKYGYILDNSTQNYWNDWVSCGKQNNACWKGHIHTVYSEAIHNRFK